MIGEDYGFVVGYHTSADDATAVAAQQYRLAMVVATDAPTMADADGDDDGSAPHRFAFFNLLLLALFHSVC